MTLSFIKHPCPHFSERSCEIDSIILHYTDMPSVDETLAWLANPSSQVSCHYLIDEVGNIYHLIDEEKEAWHAGESYWQGKTQLNKCSIGIELANPGHSHGYLPFPETQINSLLNLCQELRTRWDIPSYRILGHSDVAPRRKQDPGHLFPWVTLAQEGLGLWLDKSLAKHQNKTSLSEHADRKQISKPFTIDVTEDLAKLGYETISPLHALLAFQRHFQPHKLDGVADEETYSLLQGLLKAQEKLI